MSEETANVWRGVSQARRDPLALAETALRVADEYMRHADGDAYLVWRTLREACADLRAQRKTPPAPVDSDGGGGVSADDLPHVPGYDMVRPCCAECGSWDVQATAWIAWDAEGNEYVADSEPPDDDCWCPDCDEHVTLCWSEKDRAELLASRDAEDGEGNAPGDACPWAAMDRIWEGVANPPPANESDNENG